jgi:hypothetical protein
MLHIIRAFHCDTISSLENCCKFRITMSHFDILSRDGKADILRSGRIIFKGEYTKNDQNRSFQPAWFERFSWLEYNDDSKGAQCFYCKYLAPQASKSLNRARYPTGRSCQRRPQSTSNHWNTNVVSAMLSFFETSVNKKSPAYDNVS